jgi:hypothetical protein
MHGAAGTGLAAVLLHAAHYTLNLCDDCALLSCTAVTLPSPPAALQLLPFQLSMAVRFLASNSQQQPQQQPKDGGKPREEVGGCWVRGGVDAFGYYLTSGNNQTRHLGANVTRPRTLLSPSYFSLPWTPTAQVFDSLELTDEKINAITDKIPQRPVGVVEGTSYTAVILAAFGVRRRLLAPLIDPPHSLDMSTGLPILATRNAH